MENDLKRAMQEWPYASKEELIREAAARTWDDTVGNVWHRLAACDHLLDLKSWKKGAPPPSKGISYATATRHLRILRRRLEEFMGKSARSLDPPWLDISKEQWDLLWSGESALIKYGETLWAAGYKTVDLYSSISATEVPRIMLLNQLRRMGECRSEPLNWTTLPEIVEWKAKQPTTSAPSILDPKAPISWLKEIPSTELWEEELFQGGDIPLPPGLQMIWNQLAHRLGHHYHQLSNLPASGMQGMRTH